MTIFKYVCMKTLNSFIVIGLFTIGYGFAQKPGAPNILICVADDASYPFMGAYGCDWVKTPAFDRVAREGILFTNAYTPNAKCAPSRACILTGRNSWQLEQAANHNAYFPGKFQTYPETLLEKGYHVGYTAKGWAPGDPGRINGKTRELTGKEYSKITTKAPTRGMNNVDYAANFQEFLEDRQSGQPFCFWYGSTEPHRGYEFQSGIRKGGKGIDDIDAIPRFWPDNDTIRIDMLDFAFELEYFDQHLAKMLVLLEESGDLDNTIVVVTADNGMPFPRVKGQEYEYSNHMPLAIMWKNGIRYGGRTVEDFVSFIDFAPTFVEAAGIDAKQTGMMPIEGKSLLNIFRSKKSGIVDRSRDHVLIGKERHDVGRPHDQGYPIRGIVTEDYLYLHNFETSRWPAGNPETGYLEVDGSPSKTLILDHRLTPGMEKYWQLSFGKRGTEELYNLESDPECLINLAALPEYAQAKERLKNRLFDKLNEQDDPRMTGIGQVFDQYKAVRNRGFYERYMAGEKVKAGWVNDSDFEEEKLEE